MVDDAAFQPTGLEAHLPVGHRDKVGVFQAVQTAFGHHADGRTAQLGLGGRELFQVLGALVVDDAAMQLGCFTVINGCLVTDGIGTFALAIGHTTAAVDDLLGLCGSLGIEAVGTVDA
ncbi:hypothetical protein D3C85_1019610 [compost metagenome]